MRFWTAIWMDPPRLVSMESLFASVQFKPCYGNWNRSYRVASCKIWRSRIFITYNSHKKCAWQWARFISALPWQMCKSIYVKGFCLPYVICNPWCIWLKSIFVSKKFKLLMKWMTNFAWWFKLISDIHRLSSNRSNTHFTRNHNRLDVVNV